MRVRVVSVDGLGTKRFNSKDRIVLKGYERRFGRTLCIRGLGPEEGGSRLTTSGVSVPANLKCKRD